MKKWQIRNRMGNPIARIDAVNPKIAVRKLREQKRQMDRYYDDLYQIKEVWGIDIRLQ